MTKWPTKPLGEACEINPKQNGAERLSPSAEVSFVPMAAVDASSGTIVSAENRVLADISGSHTAFRDGDVLFAKITPCMENGKTAIAEGLANGCGFGSTEFHVLRCRSEVLPGWVWAFVRQPWFRDVAKSSFTGTAGQQRVPVEFMRRIPIPLPPLSEQERMVRILDEAEALRRLRAQADERTGGMVAAMFIEMFGEPSTNSKGWPVHRAGELMTLCEYGTSRKASDTGLGVPILRMNNVTPDGLLDLSDVKAVELSDSELAKYRLENGDVLFNRTNSRKLVGKTGMWDGRFEAVAASYFIRVRFADELQHPQHFTVFMNLPVMKCRLRAMARGAIGQANINAQELKGIELPVPPIELQRTFAARVAEIRELEAAQATSRHRFDECFRSLLHRAFQGEL